MLFLYKNKSARKRLLFLTLAFSFIFPTPTFAETPPLLSKSWNHLKNGNIALAKMELGNYLAAGPIQSVTQFLISHGALSVLPPEDLTTALQLFKKGDNEKARQAFDQLIKQNPKNADAYYYLGLIHSRLKEYPKAIELYLKALSLNEDLTDIYVSLGVAYFKTKDLDSSFEAFRETLNVDPNNSTANFYSGLILQSQEQYEESLRYFNKAKKLEPDFKQLGLYYKGLAYYKMENNEYAKQLFERTVSYNPGSDTAKNAKDLIETLNKKAKSKEKKPWNFSVAAGMEWNDNITRTELDSVTNQADTSQVYEASVEYNILKLKKLSLDTSYNFYQSLFDDATEFDYQSHTGSFGGSYNFGPLEGSLNYSYSHSFLDKKAFMAIHTITPGIGFSLHPLHYSTVNYRFESKTFFSDPARDGPAHSIGLLNFIFFMEGKAFWTTGYRFADDNTAAPQFVYGAHIANTALKFTGPWESEIKFSYEINSRNYKNITESIGEERRDDKQTFQFAFSKAFFEHYQFDLNYRHIDANSNLESVDFSENAASFNIRAEF